MLAVKVGWKVRTEVMEPHLKGFYSVRIFLTNFSQKSSTTIKGGIWMANGHILFQEELPIHGPILIEV